MSTIKFVTLNDLTPDKLTEACNKLISENNNILEKYFGFFEMAFLKNGILSFLTDKCKPVEYQRGLGMKCNDCFSQESIYIPTSLYIAFQLLKIKGLYSEGLFRKNSQNSRLDDCLGCINAIATNRVEIYRAFKDILTCFDPIDIAESYKMIIKNLNNPVFPRNTIKLAIKIANITEKYEKIICTRIVLMRMPLTNRNILENIIYLCITINHGYKSLKLKKHRMDLKGFAITLMPNMFRIDKKTETLEMVKLLSEFAIFLFENYRDCLAAQ